MAAEDVADLREVVAATAGLSGAVWTLAGSGDLNANLVRFPVGRGVGEHVNDEVDVLFFGVSGNGMLVVDGEEAPLEPGRLVLVSKGARRATHATSEDFAYLTVHRRRGPVRLGRT